MSTKQGLPRNNKTRHKPSFQGWKRQTSRKKRVPNNGKRIRDTPTSTVGNLNPSYTTIRYAQRT